MKVSIMGAFNLLHAKVICSNCSIAYSGRLQFKAGEVWQHDYQLGDVIKTSPGDTTLLGADVMAYGYLENPACPVCGFSNREEYDIFVKNLTIVGCKLMLDFSPYRWHEGGDYYFLPDNTKT